MASDFDNKILALNKQFNFLENPKEYEQKRVMPKVEKSHLNNT